MVYGGDITDTFRQTGSYTGRVLAGENSFDDLAREVEAANAA